MIITEYQINQALGSLYFSRGKNYFLSNKVISCKVISERTTSVHLLGTVAGSGNRHYEQQIWINKTQNSFIIDGDCSCPVSHNCKHVAAVCCQYLNKHNNSEQDSKHKNKVKNWLQDIKHTASAHESNDFFDPYDSTESYFLTYRIFEKNNHNPLQVYRNKILKNGNISKGMKKTLDSFCFGYDLNYCKNKLDNEITSILKNMIDRYYSSFSFDGEVGYILLLKLIASDRCYFDDASEPLCFSQESIALNFEWRKDKKKQFKLISNIDPEHFVIIPTTPIVVIDKTLNCLTHLDSDYDVDILSMLTMAPSIPTDMLIDVYKDLRFNIGNIDLPAPENYQVTTIDAYPTPQITIKQHELPFITVQFNYSEHCVEHSSPHKTAIFTQSKGEVHVRRNHEAEQQAINILENYGFSHYYDINYDPIMAIETTPTGSMQTLLESWNDFLNHHVKALKSHGWVIKFDEDFNLSFDNDSEIIVHSESENDWFSLAFDIKIGDKSYPLLPMAQYIIEEFDDLEQLPSTLYIPIQENSYTTVESHDIKPILRTIYELFERKHNNTELKLSAFDAHLIDDIDENITWKGNKDILTLSQKLKNFDGIEEVQPPQCLKMPLRNYQQHGLNWLNFLHQFKFSGILADDMGLGKTLQTLAHLSRLKESNQLSNPCIIIVPTSLVANWKNEVIKFTPNLSLLIIYGPQRSEAFEKINSHDLIITTYPLISRDADHYQNIQFDYLILDEAQKIKNPKTQMAKNINALSSNYRLALSGTPIENHLGEMWSIFHFLMPGFLLNQKLFNSHYRTPIEKEYDKDKQRKLKKRLQPFILRRTKNEVLAELPEKTEIIKYCQFDQKQTQLYESIRVTMEKNLKEIIGKKGLKRSHIHILDALLKLRQVCCHPALLKLDSAKKAESSKLNLLMDLLDELLQEGRKILLFSQFTSMLSIIEKSIKKRKISYVKLTGSSVKRDQIIEKFTKGEADVFLISLKAGGIGLNLVEADTVIHYDPWWNPAVENQATDRAHRIGQKKSVFVYKLIVENSIEQKILELQQKKSQLQNSIYDEKGELDDKQFSGSELIKLLEH